MDVLEPSTPKVRALAWLALAALVALVAALLAPTLSEVVYYPESDDGYYLRYMSEVADQGLGAIPSQVHFYLGDQRHWIFPTPTRIGFTVASALFAEIFGARMETLSYLSLASHLALIVVQFVFARRWFEQSKALLVAALSGFSTLWLGLSRLALTDAFITLVQVTTIWLFVEYVREPRRLVRQIAFGLAFTYAILTKEISVLLAAPFAAYAAVERFHRRRDVPAGRTIALLAGPGIAALVGWVIAVRDPIQLAEVLRIVLASPATNRYAIDQGSGGWYRYVVDEILMSPVPTLLGLAAVAVALWRWRRGEYGSLAIALALVYAFQLAVLSPFTKNLRYGAVLEMPLRVLGVVLLWEFARAKVSRLGRGLCTVAVAAMCWIGWSDFQLIWMRWQVYDPMTSALVTVRGLVPPPQKPARPAPNQERTREPRPRRGSQR